MITVSHPTFCCVGVGLWLRLGWAVTIDFFDPQKKRFVFEAFICLKIRRVSLTHLNWFILITS